MRRLRAAAWKIEKIKNALARADVRYEKWEDPIFLPHATRRRATLNAHKINNNIRFGYNEARTHNILDIKHCMVLEPALDAKIQGLRPYLPRLLPDNKPVDIMIQNIDGAFDLVLSGAYQTKGKFSLAQHEAMAELAESLDIARISWRPKDFAKPEILFARRDAIKRFGALSVRLSPGAFLQASAEGENALTEIVLKNTHGARAIADLFCGAGTFAGALLKSGVFIHAIDGDPGAITALSDAAKNHGQLKVSRRDLFRNPLNAEELKSFDTVIFDPPRAGAKEQATALAASKATKIIGISCNPATFARDAKILQEGGYVLQSLTLVDQFVWTAHVEMVGVFSR